MELLQVIVLTRVHASTAHYQLSSAISGELKTCKTCHLCPEFKVMDCFRCYFFSFFFFFLSNGKGRVKIMTKDFI